MSKTTLTLNARLDRQNSFREFPTDQFIVVHFREYVYVRQRFRVFI